MTFTDTLPHLSIEVLPSGLIRLENESMGDSYAVDLHPVHLRYIAEKMGRIHEATASEPELLRDLDRMKRNMLRVREHALNLQRDFANGADWEHADLSHEMGLIHALVGLLDMACDDFADDFTTEPPSEPEPVKATKKAPARQQLDLLGTTSPEEPLSATS